jgi:hypothetical protein
MAVMARRGLVRRVQVRQGVAWYGSRGEVGCGVARIGMLRSGGAVEARHGWAGESWYDKVWHGSRG